MSINFVIEPVQKVDGVEIRAFSLSLRTLLQTELSQKKRPLLKKLLHTLSKKEQLQAIHYLKTGDEAWLNQSDQLLLSLLVEKIHHALAESGQQSSYFADFVAVFMHYYDLSSSMNLLRDNLFYADYEFRLKIKDCALKIRRLEEVSQQFIPMVKKSTLIWQTFFSQREESYSLNSKVAQYLTELIAQKKWPVSVPLTEIAVYLGIPFVMYESGVKQSNNVNKFAVRVNKNHLHEWSAILEI